MTVMTTCDIRTNLVFSKELAAPQLSQHPLGQIKQGYYPHFTAPEAQRGSETCPEPPRKTEITSILKGFGKIDGRDKANNRHQCVRMCVG